MAANKLLGSGLPFSRVACFIEVTIRTRSKLTLFRRHQFCVPLLVITANSVSTLPARLQQPPRFDTPQDSGHKDAPIHQARLSKERPHRPRARNFGLSDR